MGSRYKVARCSQYLRIYLADEHVRENVTIVSDRLTVDQVRVLIRRYPHLQLFVSADARRILREL